MNAFAGFISLNHEAVTLDKIELMAAGLVAWHPDEVYYSGDSKARFVQFVRHNLPGSVNELQMPGFLHDVRLDEPQEGPQWIYQAYQHQGASLLPRLIGDYTFALWDSESESLFAVRDQMGQRLFYYVHQPGKFLAFASTISGLLAIPEISKEPNFAKFKGQLNLESPFPEQSFYKDVKRLLPGHYLEFKQGQINTRSFYNLLDIKPVRFKRDTDYKDAFLDVFGGAVQSRMRSIFPVGAHLSGGLDSSSVVAMAARDGTPLTTFSAFPPMGYAGPTRPNWNLDDTHYVMAMKAKYPHLETLFVRSEGRDFFTGLEQTYAYLDGPCLNPCNRVWIDEIFEQASSRNIRTILTGAMGNATISWKGYRFKQQLGWWLRAPRRYLCPSRWHIKDPRHMMISEGMIRDTQAFFDSERAFWGVEFRDPTHDQRLVEFCLGLPNHQFASAGVNRNLVRSHMLGLLPDAIRLRRDQGAQFAQWLEIFNLSVEKIRTQLPQISHVMKRNLEVDTSYLHNLFESWPESSLDFNQVYRTEFLRGFFVGRYLEWMLRDGRRANKEKMGTPRGYPGVGCCPRH